jgi:hypothetical protein
MGKLTGTVLILAGIAVAAYTVSSSPQRDLAPQVATGHGGDTAMTAPAPAPSIPPAASAAPVPTAARVADALPQPSPPPSPPESAAFAAENDATPAAPGPSPSRAERLAAAQPTPPVAIGEAHPRRPVGDSKAGPPLNRPALVREIQRIGCYQGNPSGVWTPAVRDAIKVVTERVNASLPIEQPDPVLLAMVQSQEKGVCSASCPAGQTPAAGGRCLPSALAASAVAASAAATRSAKERPSKAQARADQVGAAAPARTGSTPNVAALQPTAEGRRASAGTLSTRAAAYRSGGPYRAANVRARPAYRATQRPASGNSGLGWLFPF